MALSTHWEWRGFGDVSPRFAARFDTLEPAFGDGAAQVFVDEYLWIPGVDVNLKFRRGTGTQDGLKFKRLNETRETVEKWTESADEIFPFPLNPRAWELLRLAMNIPAARKFRPPQDAGRDDAIHFLQKQDLRIQTVTVKKRRRSATWGERGSVKVELAEILSPVATKSVGLEIWDPFRQLEDDASVTLLTAAAVALELDKEALRVMNYLEFIAECVA